MITRNQKYPMLSTVANILSLGGWAMVAGGAIAVLYGLGNTSGVLMFPILSGVAIAVAGLGVTTSSELIGVVFDIEHNTRTASTSGRAPEANLHG